MCVALGWVNTFIYDGWYTLLESADPAKLSLCSNWTQCKKHGHKVSFSSQLPTENCGIGTNTTHCSLVCMTAVHLSSLTACGSSRMNWEAEVQIDASKLFKFFKAKNWTFLYWPSHSPNMKSIWTRVSYAKEKPWGNQPLNQAGADDGCSIGLLEHYQRSYAAIGDDYGSQTSSSHCMPWICNRVPSSYSGSNNYLIPCWFCRFAYLQRMELCIILNIGTF